MSKDEDPPDPGQLKYKDYFESGSYSSKIREHANSWVFWTPKGESPAAFRILKERDGQPSFNKYWIDPSKFQDPINCEPCDTGEPPVDRHYVKGFHNGELVIVRMGRASYNKLRKAAEHLARVNKQLQKVRAFKQKRSKIRALKLKAM